MTQNSGDVEPPRTLTDLARSLDLSIGAVSRLVKAGAITASPGGKGVRRYIDPQEARRVQQLVDAARGLGIGPTVLILAVKEGRAYVDQDGRVVLGETDSDPPGLHAAAS